ncbi:hypothetical protein LEMLEM_LOCUS14219, partial [Lemmus lemmus]
VLRPVRGLPLFCGWRRGTVKYPHHGGQRNVGGGEGAGTPELNPAELPENQSGPSCFDLESDAEHTCCCEGQK